YHPGGINRTEQGADGLIERHLQGTANAALRDDDRSDYQPQSLRKPQQINYRISAEAGCGYPAGVDHLPPTGKEIMILLRNPGTHSHKSQMFKACLPKVGTGFGIKTCTKSRS